MVAIKFTTVDTHRNLHLSDVALEGIVLQPIGIRLSAATNPGSIWVDDNRVPVCRLCGERLNSTFTAQQPIAPTLSAMV
ncbi:hypothetical protein TNCV_1102421 [Trichonephila clavipes]|nr:hypothetical protein TNCV_1102421 [Trichonephila clavipes]